MSEVARLNEIVTAKDSLRVRVHRGGRSAEVARVSDGVRGSLGAAPVEYVRVREALSGAASGYAVERAKVRDGVRSGYAASASLADRLRARSFAWGALGARLTDVVRARDGALRGQAARMTERVMVCEQLAGWAHSIGRMTESVMLRDSLGGALAQGLVERAMVQDALRGRVGVRAQLTDELRVTDYLAGRGAALARLVEAIRIEDRLQAQYRALARPVEMIAVDDSFPAAQYGGAWTACLGAWAHSRYDAYPFSSAIVVDGMAYASGPDGVYALAGGDDPITARIRTGVLDFNPRMALPTAVYLSYSIDGDALLTMERTQDGVAPKNWSYPILRRPSDVLTTGRFLLGRGLRGRNYSMSLELTGQHARIEDMYVEFGVSQRRIYG